MGRCSLRHKRPAHLLRYVNLPLAAGLVPRSRYVTTCTIPGRIVDSLFRTVKGSDAYEKGTAFERKRRKATGLRS